ncbi:hypothetical protein IQ22_02217 [Pseudomonas duriflava]|uniref:Dolichyl-phosphate-mannose-protein mannosyltransferase n=1 Tax=Pseudomonas duriflava TaxID=459528 RepID=A0A562QC73_9PSED|nr:hypothetical protein [Pseudomonas duriflava]TWI54351.1 hypothetical protein IQ22_02217 [Pseudomonas duriflava]
MKNYFSKFSPILALLVITLFYVPVHSYDYVWDDTTLFLDSSALRDPVDLWGSISQSILPGTTYFRPAVLLSFICEFKIFDVNPSVSHIVNLLILLANCILVGLLSYKVSVDRSCKHSVEAYQRAAIAIVIYGMHPALIESTVWVAGRFDLLVTLFFLLGLVFSTWLKGWIRVVAVSFSFFCASMSKEMAVTFPLILAVWLFVNYGAGERFLIFLKNIFRKSFVFLFLGVFFSGLVYLLVRYEVHPDIYVANIEVESGLSVFQRIGLIGYTVLFYLRMIIWPFSDLNPMHPVQMGELEGISLVLNIIVCGLFFISGVLAVALCRTKGALLAVCGFIALLPVLNIIPLNIGGNIGHERFVALPLVFFVLALISFKPVELLKDNRYGKLIRLMPVFWLVLCSMNLRVTIPLWQNEFSLWSWAYSKNPNVEFIQFNYVASSIFLGQLEVADKALSEIEKKEKGLSSRMKAVKGQLLIRQGRLLDANVLLEDSLSDENKVHEEVLRKGISLHDAKIVRDNVPNAWFLRYVYGSLVESYVKQERYDDALSNLSIMEFYSPEYPVSMLMRALINYGKGDVELGDAFFVKALDGFASLAHEKVYETRAKFIKDICDKDGSQKACNMITGSLVSKS